MQAALACAAGHVHCVHCVLMPAVPGKIQLQHVQASYIAADLTVVLSCSPLMVSAKLLQIDALTGEKYYQSVTWVDGKMLPGEWKRYGCCCDMDTNTFIWLTAAAAPAALGLACGFCN
jgi:hypothetical protein